MTDPIAVDTPSRPSYSRSVPPDAPALPPAPSPVSAPKVEPPRPTPAVAVTAAVAAPVVPVPLATAAAPAAGSFMAQFTKKQLLIGAAAALSLAAGIGAVRMMFPAKDAPTPVVASAGDKVQLTSPPAPAASNKVDKAPAVEERPPPRFEPLVPAAHAAPIQPPGALPFPPPTIHPDPPPLPTPDFGALPGPAPAAPPAPLPLYQPPASNFGGAPPVPPPAADFALSPLPTPNLLPIGASEPPKTPPATPPTPALPPIPAPAPGMVLPVPPAPSVAADTTKPLIPPPGGFAPVVPQPPAGAPMLPAPTTFTPGGAIPPVMPAKPDAPAPAVPEPTLTPIPAPTPGGAGAVAPSIFPAPSEGPKIELKPTPQPDFKPVPEVKPPQPEFNSQPPAVEPPGALGTPTGFTKPAGATEAKPDPPAFAPKTTFDVDVYDPRAGDTYDTISQEFYNDKRFGAALKTFNKSQPLQGGRYVNVPPVHVLKRQFPATGGAEERAPSSAAQWGTAPARPAASGGNVFVVPRGGLTLEEVAKRTMGDTQRWRDIYDLNPQVTNTRAPVAAGTELKLPPDARIP